jgi:SEC-C motif
VIRPEGAQRLRTAIDTILLEMAKRARRNDRCRCGSGLKYKLCHLEWDRAGISPDAPPPDTKPVGSLAGYDILVLGERPYPDRWQRWEIPAGAIQTKNPAEVFEARVGAFSLDSIVSLTADLTRRFWKDSTQFNEKLGLWGGDRALFSFRSCSVVS